MCLMRSKFFISDNDKIMLTVTYSSDEVKAAFDTMFLNKASGPDGMTASFYKKYWHLIGDDVSKAVLHVLNNGGSVQEVNKTFITLVPKIKAAYSVKDFRPIALCNVIYKLVAKVLAIRFCLALDSVIGDH